MRPLHKSILVIFTQAKTTMEYLTFQVIVFIYPESAILLFFEETLSNVTTLKNVLSYCLNKYCL